MPELNYALLIGNLITIFPAIIYSVWKETRYVEKIPALLYSLASLGSGILFYADFGYTEIGLWALGVFTSLFVIYLLACWKLDIWGEENVSLPFSHKTIGGFQIAFFYQIYLVSIFGTLPILSTPISPAQNVVLWGFIFVGILYLATLIAKTYKNRE